MYVVCLGDAHLGYSRYHCQSQCSRHHIKLSTIQNIGTNSAAMNRSTISINQEYNTHLLMNTIEQVFEHFVYTHGLNTQQRLYSLTDRILSSATIPWRRAAVTLHILEMSLNIGSNCNTLWLIDDMFLTSIYPTKCTELHPARAVIFRWSFSPPICVGLKIGVAGRVGLVCSIWCVSARVMVLVGGRRFL